ncbi:MAG: mechanosensitive ion channel [Nannocystaceae bacterium]
MDLAFLDDRRVALTLCVLVTLGVAFVVERTLLGGLARLAARTQTTLDDLVIAALRRPIFYSVVAFGAARARAFVDLSERSQAITSALLETLVLLLWGRALLKICGALLRLASDRARPDSLFQGRTLPFFEILAKLSIVGGAVYLAMLAWKIDVAGWVTSLGILGLALGLAAEDSLANLFGGIAIVADAPFKLGDFVQFQDGLRGRVTHIGIRSTRILTRDDTEVIVPNALLIAAKILNETGGPSTKQRVRTTVAVALGSDLVRVRELLLGATVGHPDIADTPAPEVLFDALGGGGIECRVLVWVPDPTRRDPAISELNFRIYKALTRAGIEIPYGKHDLDIREVVAAMLDGSTPDASPPAEPEPEAPAPAA